MKEDSPRRVVADEDAADAIDTRPLHPALQWVLLVSPAGTVQRIPGGLLVERGDD